MVYFTVVRSFQIMENGKTFGSMMEIKKMSVSNKYQRLLHTPQLPLQIDTVQFSLSSYTIKEKRKFLYSKT